MSLFLGLIVLSGAAGIASAECVPVLKAVEDAGLSTLVELVTEPEMPGKGSHGQAMPSMAKMLEQLAGDRKFTLFGPTDEAFNEFAAAHVDHMDADLHEEGPRIAAVLLHHVVEGDHPADNIRAAIAEKEGEAVILKTILGSELLLTADDDGDTIYITPKGSDAPPAEIIEADIMSCQGWVHVVDRVLVGAPDGAGRHNMFVHGGHDVHDHDDDEEEEKDEDEMHERHGDKDGHFRHGGVMGFGVDDDGDDHDDEHHDEAEKEKKMRGGRAHMRSGKMDGEHDDEEDEEEEGKGTHGGMHHMHGNNDDREEPMRKPMRVRREREDRGKPKHRHGKGHGDREHRGKDGEFAYGRKMPGGGDMHGVYGDELEHEAYEFEGKDEEHGERGGP